MDASILHDAIADVCPITGCSVGDPNDRATWHYDPAPEATPAQITAADNVVATIPIIPAGKVPTTDFIARWTNAEYLGWLKKRRDDIAANKIGNAKNWDIVVADNLIDMNKKKVKTLKDSLVTDLVLTQARADIIFA